MNKTYDGTTNAAVNLSDDKLAGDAVTDSYTSAYFADKVVGNSKPVTVEGIGISGADVGNYTLASATGSTSADITPRSLTVTAGSDAAIDPARNDDCCTAVAASPTAAHG